jgi:hypothetical protein
MSGVTVLMGYVIFEFMVLQCLVHSRRFNFVTSEIVAVMMMIHSPESNVLEKFGLGISVCPDINTLLPRFQAL